MANEKYTSLHNIGVLHTFTGGPRRGNALNDTTHISDAAVVWDESGKIVDVDRSETIRKKYLYADVTWIDAGAKMVTPGLIDSHTHSVNAGSRANEFVMRCMGADYMEILNAGGGILNSADKTRNSTIGKLIETGRRALDESLRYGVATIECKSGYGLNTETELKMLRAIKSLDATHTIRILPTFLGAHAVPREYKDKPDDYVDLIINEMIPAVTDENLAQYVDVFIEDGVFSTSQGRRIIETGIEYGMKPKIHADEIRAIGATELGVELGALSVDHLIAITDSGIKKLAESETVGCLLPGTSFFLKKPYAPCRKMIDSGCLVALATDNNPGSSRTENIQWIMTVACLYYGLTPSEAFSMVTINAAKALGMDESIGSVEIGKIADLVLWETRDINEVVYHHGHNHVSKVFSSGKQV